MLLLNIAVERRCGAEILSQTVGGALRSRAEMMTESEEEVHARGSSEFIESSVLSTIIPLDAQFDINEVLSSSDPSEEADSPLAVVPHRQALFFGKSSL